MTHWLDRRFEIYSEKLDEAKSIGLEGEEAKDYAHKERAKQEKVEIYSEENMKMYRENAKILRNLGIPF